MQFDKPSPVRKSIAQLQNRHWSLAELLNIVGTFKVSLEQLKDNETEYVATDKFNSVLEISPVITHSENKRTCNK